MKTFSIKFFDIVEAENINDVYMEYIEYLENCVKNEDLEGFEINEIKKEGKQ